MTSSLLGPSCPEEFRFPIEFVIPSEAQRRDLLYLFLCKRTHLFNSNTPFSTLRSVEQVDTLTQVVENERDWQAADLLLSMNLAKVRNVARSSSEASR
jgi:hypothetical protein